MSYIFDCSCLHKFIGTSELQSFFLYISSIHLLLLHRVTGSLKKVVVFEILFCSSMEPIRGQKKKKEEILTLNVFTDWWDFKRFSGTLNLNVKSKDFLVPSMFSQSQSSENKLLRCGIRLHTSDRETIRSLFGSYTNAGA